MKGENVLRFLNDEAYYEDSNDFCLGETLEEAGEIIRQILKEREHDSHG